MIHYKTKEQLVFNSAEELIQFFKCLNPTLLKHYKSQYEREFPGFKVVGIGEGLKIIKKQLCINILREE